VLISASQGTVAFDANFVVQRMSLALANGQVIIGSAPWNMKSPATMPLGAGLQRDHLKQSAAFATTTVGSLGGGVWQSGSPPAVDGSHNVYCSWQRIQRERLRRSQQLCRKRTEVEHRAPVLGRLVHATNWAHLDEYDLDLTSAGRC